MTKKEVYLVGTQLMGLYFAVIGIASLCSILVNGIAQWRAGRLTMLVAPAVYLGVSLLLIKKTSWCLSKTGITKEDNSEHNTGE